MDGKMLARLGAVVFVGVAITAAVIELSRQPEPDALRPIVRERGDADAMRQMLRRCRDMGEAATRDSTCLKVWAESRDRFLKQGAAAPDAPGAPTTLWPSTPPPAEDPAAKDAAPADTPSSQPEPLRPEMR